MTVYTFILRETAAGKHDHGHKNQRRQDARDYVEMKGCTILGDPQDMYVEIGGAGVWHYWWYLDIPSDTVLNDIKTQFTVTNRFVEFAVAPVKPNP